MEDDDDFERIAGKTRTESAELRRQSEARRPRDRLLRILAVVSTPGFLAVSFAAVIGLVVFRMFR